MKTIFIFWEDLRVTVCPVKPIKASDYDSPHVFLCWVMCFDITHILSNLGTKVTFKEWDVFGLKMGIVLFSWNDVLFISSTSLILRLSPPCSEWQLLQKPCWGPQRNQPQRSRPWPFLVSDTTRSLLYVWYHLPCIRSRVSCWSFSETCLKLYFI